MNDLEALLVGTIGVMLDRINTAFPGDEGDVYVSAREIQRLEQQGKSLVIEPTDEGVRLYFGDASKMEPGVDGQYVYEDEDGQEVRVDFE